MRNMQRREKERDKRRQREKDMHAEGEKPSQGQRETDRQGVYFACCICLDCFRNSWDGEAVKCLTKHFQVQLHSTLTGQALKNPRLVLDCVTVATQIECPNPGNIKSPP